MQSFHLEVEHDRLQNIAAFYRSEETSVVKNDKQWQEKNVSGGPRIVTGSSYTRPMSNRSHALL